MVNGIVSLISLSDFLLLVHINGRDFCALMFFSPATLSNSLISPNSFLVAFLKDFLDTLSCHLQTVTVMLLIFQFVFLLFVFLLWLPWLGLPKLCWIIVMRVDNLFLFLILVEMVSVFHHWEWRWLWASHIWPLLCWGVFPLCPLSREFL